jgi:hypothetical protein
MSALSQTISSAFASYYEMIRCRVHELVDPLQQEQIWRRPFPYGNSIGNLLLHLTQLELLHRGADRRDRLRSISRPGIF